MYVNKCIKCGREFETKNPKRVICPNCLYPDKNMMIDSNSNGGNTPQTSEQKPSEPMKSYSTDDRPQYRSSYSSGQDDQQGYQRPSYNQGQGNYRPRQNNYNNNRQGGYNNNRSNYGNNRQNYNRPYNNNRQGSYNNRYNNNRPMNRRVQGNNRYNNQNRRPMNNRNKAPKQLLVSKEQLAQIELLYKLMLPLPNPDAHEVIGEKIGLEPRKVFFGINLIRQKMMLPKLPYPKRKLAITPDQLNAIKTLYEPLLPLPPIGCHKIIAAQLKMDEWRVHVGIGLVRAQMGLDRWNPNRPDAPEEFRKQAEAEAKAKPEKKNSAKAKAEPADENSGKKEESPAVEEPKKKRGRPKKSETPSEE